jgi:hypothetical protein
MRFIGYKTAHEYPQIQARGRAHDGPARHCRSEGTDFADQSDRVDTEILRLSVLTWAVQRMRDHAPLPEVQAFLSTEGDVTDRAFLRCLAVQQPKSKQPEICTPILPQKQPG